jgi:RNA polymerase sigma-70 factor (ECF subfamily)
VVTVSTGASAPGPADVPASGLEAATDAPDFDDFYRAEYRGLVRLATALCGRVEVAEELVQDAMVSVLGRWRRVREYDKPGAFARRVVLNAAASHHRRRRAEHRALARVRVDTVAWSPEISEFWHAVRDLPARQAQVVTLYYAEDMAVADIAAVLDIAPGTVRATLDHARRALAARLQPQLGGVEEDR